MYFLFISTGLTLNLHYCEGEIENIAFFDQKADCKMHKEDLCKMAHCQMNHHTKNSPNCCTDKSIYLHLDSKPIVSSLNISLCATELEVENQSNVALLDEIGDQQPPAFLIKHLETYPPPFILFHQLLVYA